MEMQRILSANIAITPIPKPRPKFRVLPRKKGQQFGGGVQTYYQNDYLKLEEALSATLREHISREMRGKVCFGAVSVELTLGMPIPSSLTNREYGERLGRPHIFKPDIDNLEKHVLDAVNHVGIWKDDCQVARVVKEKIWAPAPGFILLEIHGADVRDVEEVDVFSLPPKQAVKAGRRKSVPVVPIKQQLDLL